MVISYKNESGIKFPVFILSSSDWERADGLLTLEGKVLDDLNQIGESLGVRRLQTPIKNLYQLKKQADTLISMAKCKETVFIDTNGLPFIYEKTKWFALKYLKISKVVKKSKCSVIYVDKCKTPFTIPRPPDTRMKYAGILFYNEQLPWRLYEYSETCLKTTRRKI